MLGGVLLGGTLAFFLTFSPALAWIGQTPIRVLGELAQMCASWTGLFEHVEKLGLTLPIDRIVTAGILGLVAAIMLGASRGKTLTAKLFLSVSAGALAVGNTAVEWASIGRPDPTAWEVLPLVIAALAVMVVLTSATEKSADKASNDASA